MTLPSSTLPPSSAPEFKASAGAGGYQAHVKTAGAGGGGDNLGRGFGRLSDADRRPALVTALRTLEQADHDIGP